MAKCLIEGCEGKSVSRGLCHSCYTTATRKVKRGAVTWEELEAAGLTKPAAAKRGRSAFSAAFERFRPPPPKPAKPPKPEPPAPQVVKVGEQTVFVGSPPKRPAGESAKDVYTCSDEDAAKLVAAAEQAKNGMVEQLERDFQVQANDSVQDTPFAHNSAEQERIERAFWGPKDGEKHEIFGASPWLQPADVEQAKERPSPAENQEELGIPSPAVPEPYANDPVNLARVRAGLPPIDNPTPDNESTVDYLAKPPWQR